MSKYKTLIGGNMTDAEIQLYKYTGYYPQQCNKPNTRLYIQTDHRGIGYGYASRTLCPGSITLDLEQIDMSKNIVFYLETGHFTLGDISVDPELLRILNKLAEEFKLEEKQDDLYRHQMLFNKIIRWRDSKDYPDKLPDNLTDDEMFRLLEHYYDNTNWKEY